MAPLPDVAGVLRIFMSGKVDGNDVYNWGNVLHFRYTGGPPSSADCATIAAAVESEWATNMAPECPSPTTLTRVLVTDLTSNTSGQGEWLGSTAGTRGDDSIPSNAAVLVTYPSPVRYRGGHPRQYLYVLGNADLDGAAMWSTLATAEVQTHWRSFLTGCLTITAGSTALSGFCTIKYYGKFAPNGGPPRYQLDTPVVLNLTPGDAVTAQEMASQRRRIGRRKRHA